MWEEKVFDLDLDDAGVASAGAITDSILKGIRNGDEVYEREGRRIMVTGVGWNWRLRLDARDDTDPVVNGRTGRVILYLDRQCNGATAGVTDVLASADYQAFQNVNTTRGRFEVLYDCTKHLGFKGGAGMAAPNEGDWAGQAKGDETWIPLDHTFYFRAADDGTVADLPDCNLGVLLIGDSGTATLSFESKLRVVYCDY